MFVSVTEYKEKPIASFSSPPCFLHELQDGFAGFEAVDPQQALDVARWRNAMRQQILQKRAALSVDERKQRSEMLGRTLIHFLDQRLYKISEPVLSGYWPIKSEPDLRETLAHLDLRGVRLALPVVVQKSSPLEFHSWRPGDKMERGFWNIAVPATKINVTPDILLAPLFGWDRAGYRLGYGGGYFDRTLAALTSPRRVIGVGFHDYELKTIFPQPHDVQLDAIVTEQGLQWSRE